MTNHCTVIKLRLFLLEQIMAGRECAEMVRAVEAVSSGAISVTAAALQFGVSRHGLHAALRRRRDADPMARVAAMAVRAGANEALAAQQFGVSVAAVRAALRGLP